MKGRSLRSEPAETPYAENGTYGVVGGRGLVTPSYPIWMEGGMKINYKPLWKLLIDKDLKKKDLCEMAGISPASVTKMGKCGHVTTETLEKISHALNCRVEDILELEPGADQTAAEEPGEDYSQGYEMKMTM